MVHNCTSNYERTMLDVVVIMHISLKQPANHCINEYCVCEESLGGLSKLFMEKLASL